MNEHTYGWYPSAKNVYEERRMGALTPYQIEALYRYQDSKYYQPPVTPPEQQSSKHYRHSPSPVSRSKSTASRTSSRGQGYPQPDLQQMTANLRVTSAPIHTTYKRPPKLNLPTPLQCWSTHVPETEITVPYPPSPAPTHAHASPVPLPPKSATPQATPVHMSPAPVPTPQSVKIARIQSAKVRRETPSKPQRPVKSAGPIRPSATPSVDTPVPAPPQFVPWPYPCGDVNYNVTFADRPPSGIQTPVPPPVPSPSPSIRRSTSHASAIGKPPSGRKSTPLRPKAPSPAKMEYHLDMQDRADTPDYMEETAKHGWMMEVHGDPLKLKKVSRRLPYTVKCAEPETERDPPKVHMENIETFFLNTIPRRPANFSINKEWISEVLHEKRLEMQKKHGVNYRYKNFSFVY